MPIFILIISCLTTSNLPWFMDLTNILGSYAILFFAASDFIFITRHIHNWRSFLLWLRPFILSEGISSCPSLFPVANLTPSDLGDSSSASYLFVFLYSSWGSHGKYPGVVCHSLLQWITFCQNSSLWPVHLGWPCMAWLIASWVMQASLPWQEVIREEVEQLPHWGQGYLQLTHVSFSPGSKFPKRPQCPPSVALRLGNVWVPRAGCLTLHSHSQI